MFDVNMLRSIVVLRTVREIKPSSTIDLNSGRPLPPLALVTAIVLAQMLLKI